MSVPGVMLSKPGIEPLMGVRYHNMFMQRVIQKGGPSVCIVSHL